ncbi:hypothetical protein KIL84_018467 [Mauremys mutica]|uniref:Uncharacterized protein n=1 Tax=Mauremys mutica TaxID=74926 RepID=A0A9D3XT95_9SAUR|nr:hypothetical protein KIL84_018467 [Mauremys mutica]
MLYNWLPNKICHICLSSTFLNHQDRLQRGVSDRSQQDLQWGFGLFSFIHSLALVWHKVIQPQLEFREGMCLRRQNIFEDHRLMEKAHLLLISLRQVVCL